MFINSRNSTKFLINTISFATLHSSLICIILIPFFKDSGMNPMQLSILLVTKKIIKMIMDIPFGIIFDKYGAKTTFCIGRICKIITFLILTQKHSFNIFFLAMLFDGISYSSLYGKINAYIYNFLSKVNELNKYQKFVAIYYGSVDIFLSLVSLLVIFLKNHYGYIILIKISIIMSILSLFILLLLPSDKKILREFQVTNLSEIYTILNKIIKQKKYLLYLLIFSGFGNFIAWQFGSTASMILLDMQYSATNITFVGVLSKISMAIGSLIVITGLKKNLSIKLCTIIMLTLNILILISALLYNGSLFILSILVTTTFYTLISVNVDKYFESITNSKIRGTTSSISWIFCSIFTIIDIFSIGYIADIYSYKIGFIITSIISTLFALLLFYLLRNIKENITTLNINFS